MSAHGTASRYASGCRCAACRCAKSRLDRRRYQIAKNGDAADATIESLMASAAKPTATIHMPGVGDVEVRL